MVGKQILNYKLTKFIGDGAMATVYEAENINLGSRVAVKIMHQHLIRQEDTRERFVNEAKMMANIEHKNIGKIYDLYQDEKMVAYVMEYLEGQPLDEYIKSKGSLLFEEAKNIFLQILEGMSYAHAHKIVHRDLKPGNVFIKTDGTVKIIDFGIAKDLSAQYSKTATGMMMGTPYYMSPEQVVDPKSVDWRSDIYSLGIIFFYLVNGFPPFDKNDTLNTIFNKIVNEPLPLISSQVEFSPIIAKATAKSPEDRFQTCEEFMLYLQNPEIFQPNEQTDETVTIETPNELIEDSEKEKITDKKVETIPPVKEIQKEEQKIVENQAEKIKTPEKPASKSEVKKNRNEIVDKPQTDKKGGSLKIFLIIILVLVFFGVGAYFFFFNKNVNSWEIIDYSIPDSKAYSCVATPEGDYIVVGSVVGTESLDWLIAKYSKSGKLIWSKQIGDSGGDLAHKIIATSDGNYVIAGGTYSSSRQDAQAWIVKIDGDGNELWNKKFGNNDKNKGWDEATDIIENSNHELVFVTVEEASTKNYGIYKISLSSGSLIWYNDVGYNNDDTPYSITQASNGNYYIVGKSEGTKTSKLFLVIVTDDGDLMKNITYGDFNHKQVGKTILENNGDFYIGGYKDDDAYLLVVDSKGKVVSDYTYDYLGVNQIFKLNNGKLALVVNSDNYSGILILSNYLSIEEEIKMGYATVLKSAVQTSDLGIFAAGYTSDAIEYLVKTDEEFNIAETK